MSLVRWKPMNDMFQFHNDVSRLFDDALRTPASWMPQVDILEDDEAFRLVAELPGVNKDDVKIAIEDGVLSLRGEKKIEHREHNGRWHRIERSHGTFERRFRVGSGVEPGEVKASFENGVLTVTLPKSEIAKTREISID